MKLDAHEMRLLSQLLDECTGLPDAERAAWLDGLSGDAARLRAHLVRLLALQSGAELDRFLAQPPQLPAAVAVEPPVGQFAADQRIGPYRLLPGYTAEGQKAGKGAVITLPTDPLLAVPVWMNTLYHRVPLLDPRLQKVGFAHVPVGDGRWVCVLYVKP